MSAADKHVIGPGLSKVPDGYRLGKGWEFIHGVAPDWGCSHPKRDGSDHCNRAARYRHKTENKGHPLWLAGACADVKHAVSLGALVKVDAEG